MIRLVLALIIGTAWAHMPDRPDLNSWFNQLASKRGMCCSFADGLSLTDVDWDIRDDGHYTVKLEGQWYLVPDEAVLTVPNRYGQAIVWPYKNSYDTSWQIRCFIPGAGT